MFARFENLEEKLLELEQMLADPSQSQLEVSMSLGYADAANFTRAFRHWTGVTPTDFRRSMEHSPEMA